MTIKKIDGQIQMISDYEAELHFELGGESFSLPFKIECPDQRENEDFHEITKNGHAIKTKARNQQYYCKTCHKYFYANTSRFFIQFETKIKQRIEYHLMNGNLKNFDLAKLCNWSISGAGRILDKILEEIGDKVPYIREKLGKIHLKIVFMDETFLKIKGKTWYLIMAISETGIILGAELKEHRDQETLIRMMHEIEKQLDTPIPIFATDGLSTYKGVALALHHDLIHVRHIHAPPYGRIEIDAIKLLSTPGKVEVTTISTMNDIFQNGGVFLARVQRNMVSTLNVIIF